MAYNNLSGTVAQPNKMLPRKDANGRVVVPIISGSLSTSDAAEVINIPRVSNATNNSILTNVGGDANTLTCESNLKFDGTTLNVVGDITASIGVSANTLYAGESFFTGTVRVSASGGLIITGSITPSGSNAFSLGSANNRWKELFVGTGSIHIGTNGATIASNNAQDIITFNKTLSSSMNISASAFYGDGSNLINVKADHVVAEGPAFSVQFHDGADGDLTGSANLTFQNNILNLGGGLRLPRRTLTATATASATDYFVGIDTTSNPVDFRLPNAASLLSGQTFIIKDEGGIAHTNNITILASGSQTIDGQNSIVLESPFASVQLYCNGTNKYFIY